MLTTEAAPPQDTTTTTTAADDTAAIEDLDIEFLEAGDTVEHLIYMTDDECGKTCQSACSTTCP